MGHAIRVPIAASACQRHSIMFHYEKAWQDVRSRIARAAHACGRDAEDGAARRRQQDVPGRGGAGGPRARAAGIRRKLRPGGRREDGRSRRSHRHRVAPRSGRCRATRRRPPPHPFAWVQTIDREKIAARSFRRRVPQDTPPLDVCIEVNASGEASKSGVAPAEAVNLGDDGRRRCPGLRLRGIMGIPEPTARRRRCAGRSSACCASVSTPASPPALPVDTLSMGMSADLEDAIAEGATLVRVGTAIFGARDAREPVAMATTFIGGGNMATALIGGMLARGAVAHRFPGGGALRRRAGATRARSLPASRCIDECTREAIAGAALVVLAVKPQQMREAARALAPHLGACVSAPVVLVDRRRHPARRISRAGCAGTSGSSGPSRTLRRSSARASRARSPRRRSMPQAARLVSSVLAAAGEQIWVDDEAMLDAVTAVSGSGPAYVFYFLEALEAAARESGIRPGGGAPPRLRRPSADPSRSAQASEPEPRDAARPGDVEGRHDRARDRRRWKRGESRRKSSRR